MRRACSPRLPAAARPHLSAALGVSIVLIGVTAASCGGDDSAVELGSVSRASVAEVVDVSGSVTARAAATLTAPADGVLAEVRVGAGDSVRAGQVLAVIDSPVARDRLRQARQALDAAGRSTRAAGGGAELARAQRGTDRAAAQAFDTARAAAGQLADPALRAALLAQIQAARRQYDAAARATAEAVRGVRRGVAGLNSAVRALSAAQRLQAQQAYDLAKATVDALTLRAPIGGVVQPGGTAAGSATPGGLAGPLGAAGAPDAPGGSAGTPAGRAVDPAGAATAADPGANGLVPVGGRVAAGTPILTIVDVADLGLVAEVDETDVLLVRPGLAATVQLDAVPGAAYPAEVRSVDVLPTASAGGGVAYRARFTLGAGHTPEGTEAPSPRPGMSAVIQLRVREAADAVTVPASAVFSADGRDAVWVVRAGRVDRARVTVGVQGQELVQIVDGVRPGERVVVRGTTRVRTGQQVR